MNKTQTKTEQSSNKQYPQQTNKYPELDDMFLDVVAGGATFDGGILTQYRWAPGPGPVAK